MPLAQPLVKMSGMADTAGPLALAERPSPLPKGAFGVLQMRQALIHIDRHRSLDMPIVSSYGYCGYGSRAPDTGPRSPC